MRLLRDRYKNQATKQQRINEANNSLKNLIYRNERSMSFEKFSGLLKKAVDTLTECGRAPHNGDLVDGLWTRIQNPELTPYINALKVQYQMNGRTFHELLQDIASQVPILTNASRNFRNVSEVSSNRNNHNNNNNNQMDMSQVTQDGECPNEGAYNGDGKLFVGKYSYYKWMSPSVKPHHGKIRKARKTLNIHKRNYNKAGGNAKWKHDFISKNKRIVSKLNAEIQELRSHVDGGSNNEGQSQNNQDNSGGTSNSQNSNNAGNAFGGRSSRSRQVSQITSSSRHRLIAPLHVSQEDSREQNYAARCELDSHADTIVAGGNCLLLNYTDRACTVHAYDEKYQPHNDVPVVKAATGYTSKDGRNYILILNEALWMPDLGHTLINPNQLRAHGVEVQDNPYTSEPMLIRTWDEEFSACLQSKGATIFINTWRPSLNDMSLYPKIILSSECEWDPSKIEFPNTPDCEMLEIESRNVAMVNTVDRSKCTSHCEECSSTEFIYNPMELCKRLINSVRICPSRYDISLQPNINSTSVINATTPRDILKEDELQPAKTFISKERHSNLTPEEVARSNQWYLEWTGAVHHQNLVLTLDYFCTNCHDDLFIKTNEEYKLFDDNQKGGPLFFILMIGNLLSNTREAAKSLEYKITNYKLTEQKGEDVSVSVSHLRGAMSRLIHIKQYKINNEAHTEFFLDMYFKLLKVFQTTS